MIPTQVSRAFFRGFIFSRYAIGPNQSQPQQVGIDRVGPHNGDELAVGTTHRINNVRIREDHNNSHLLQAGRIDQQ